VKVIEASDVILEVLDARDPLGTRCVDMEKMVLKADPSKRIVLLLNKIGMKYFKIKSYWGWVFSKQITVMLLFVGLTNTCLNPCYPSF
jgi:ribosome biogenesis GTPase A